MGSFDSLALLEYMGYFMMVTDRSYFTGTFKHGGTLRQFGDLSCYGYSLKVLGLLVFIRLASQLWVDYLRGGSLRLFGLLSIFLWPAYLLCAYIFHLGSLHTYVFIIIRWLAFVLCVHKHILARLLSSGSLLYPDSLNLQFVSFFPARLLMLCVSSKTARSKFKGALFIPSRFRL